MTLLKAEDFVHKGGKKEIFNLNDIAAEAREMIAAAQRECERLLDQARADIKRQFHQARQEGHQEGYQKGLAEGSEKGEREAMNEARAKFAQDSADTLKVLESTLQYFDQVKEDLLWRAEQETVALALAIAEKVIKQTAENNPAVTAANVRASLELVARNTEVTVKVNPGDLEHLEKMADKKVLGNFSSIKIEPDGGIAPGGCRLETGHGQVDAQLETQISRIADELLMAEVVGRTEHSEENESGHGEKSPADCSG